MSRLNTFHLKTKHWPTDVGEMCCLDGPEAAHMLKVLRHTAGDVVRLIDGQGLVGIFEIVDAGKKRAELLCREFTRHSRPESGITVAIGWSKSSRRPYLLEKSVEFQASGVAFWQARRSQGKIPSETKDSWLDKCIQAAKQCGSLFHPTLTVLKDESELQRFSEDFEQRYLAWERSNTESPLLGPDMLKSGNVLVVIGPEGGFAGGEAESLIVRGFQPVNLGSSILRWETAAIHCMSLAYYSTGVVEVEK